MSEIVVFIALVLIGLFGAAFLAPLLVKPFLKFYTKLSAPKPKLEKLYLQVSLSTLAHLGYKPGKGVHEYTRGWGPFRRTVKLSFKQGKAATLVTLYAQGKKSLFVQIGQGTLTGVPNEAKLALLLGQILTR